MAKLKCDICGGVLVMDGDGKSSTCENCGTAYSLAACRFQENSSILF
jgi:hypothetical protein